MHKLTICLAVICASALSILFTNYRRTDEYKKRQCLRLCRKNNLNYREVLSNNGYSVDNALLFLRCFYK